MRCSVAGSCCMNWRSSLFRFSYSYIVVALLQFPCVIIFEDTLLCSGRATVAPSGCTRRSLWASAPTRKFFLKDQSSARSARVSSMNCCVLGLHVKTKDCLACSVAVPRFWDSLLWRREVISLAATRLHTRDKPKELTSTNHAHKSCTQIMHTDATASENSR